MQSHCYLANKGSDNLRIKKQGKKKLKLQIYTDTEQFCENWNTLRRGITASKQKMLRIFTKNQYTSFALVAGILQAKF